MANNQTLSPQGYNITEAPLNTNPFYDTETGGNVPAGGATGQVLAKKSEADFDTEWVDGGATRQYVNEQTGKVSQAVTAETTARQTADTELSKRITDAETRLTEETANRQTGDNNIRNALTAEAEARVNGVNSLAQSIAQLTTSLEQEAYEREATDTEMEDRIFNLEQNSEAGAVAQLETRVSEVETDVATLETAVGGVQTAVTNEASNRQTADNGLAERITQETNERVSGDNSLNERITQLDGALDTLSNSTATEFETVKKSIEDINEVPAGGDVGQVLTMGADGAEWADAQGGGSSDNPLPVGGTTGQVLAKKSNSDYDVEWVDDKTGGGGSSVQELPAGGTTGQVLAKKSNTDYDVEWVNDQTGGGSSGGGFTRVDLLSAKPLSLASAFWNAGSKVMTVYKTHTDFVALIEGCSLMVVELVVSDVNYSITVSPEILRTQDATLIIPYGYEGRAIGFTSGGVNFGVTLHCLESVKPSSSLTGTLTVYFLK